MKKMRGFSVIGVIIAVVVVAIIAIGAYFVIDGNNKATDFSKYDFNSVNPITKKRIPDYLKIKYSS